MCIFRQNMQEYICQRKVFMHDPRIALDIPVPKLLFLLIDSCKVLPQSLIIKYQ